MKTALTIVSSLIVGFVFRQRFPFPEGEFLLQLTQIMNPWIYEWFYWSWTAMLFTTPALCFAGVFSLVYIFAGDGGTQAPGKLPPFPIASDDKPLHVVLGEVHHPRKLAQVESPYWLTIPERGLFTGIAVFGAIGSGKTTSCLHPYADQILSWNAQDEEKKVGAFALEVKGDFCHKVSDILTSAARTEDYIELSMDCNYRYNPLLGNSDPHSVAYSIATLMMQLYGEGKEPFWHQASTNLVKFIIIAHRVVDEYVTLFQVYESAISPQKFLAKIAEGDALFAGLASPPRVLHIDAAVYLRHDELGKEWTADATGMSAPYTDELAAMLDGFAEPYEIEVPTAAGDETSMLRRLAEFEAVKRWVFHDWLRIKPELRTSIVEGVSSFLSNFDSNWDLKRIFCPPKEVFDKKKNADFKLGRPLPSFADMIEQGKVFALNMPVAANSATARMIGTLLKNDYQRAVLMRIPKMVKEPKKYWRATMFLVDEYHNFATVGERHPNGDEKFFALSREARCVVVWATQSISSLRSALPGESWRTLLQCPRTKLFLTTNDESTAKFASDMAGRTEQLIPSVSISESGNDARASWLTGRTQSHKASVTITKNYSPQQRPMFEAKQFMELGNMQAIAIAYDGRDPIPPTLLCLKPQFAPREMSYFEQREAELI